MSILEKLVGTNIKKIGMASLLYVCAGCSNIPIPGEFHERTTTSFPAHPVIMFLDAGEIRCKRTYDGLNLEDGYTVAKYHWLFGKQGEQNIPYPRSASNFGSNAGGNIFGVHTNQTYDLGGQRFMRTYQMDNNCKKINKVEKFLIEKRKNRWEKVKGSEKED